MQCPSCQFENMPGSGNCARCGASLTLAATAINVHPPRAGKLTRVAPSLWMLRRAWYTLRAGVASAIAALLHPDRITIGRRPTLLGMIVPGLAQVQIGDRPRGFLLLGMYAGFLVPSIFLTGTMLGSFLLGLAFATHVTAVTDSTASSYATSSDRIRFTVAAGLALLVLLYLPLGWAISRVATPIQIALAQPPFNQGDVLWYNRSATPAVGDLVLYEVPGASVNGRLSDGRAARIVIEGQRVNRIVASSGQTVRLQEGQLLVDDMLSPWQPATLVATDERPPLTVPADQFFILPDYLVPPNVELAKELWAQVSLVRQESVVGRVYFRSLPLSRLTVVH